jgi:hypothetical protein
MGVRAAGTRWLVPACSALTCAVVLCATNGTVAAAQALNLVCTGKSYKAEGPIPAPETYSLVIGGAKSVLTGGPGNPQPAKAPIVANNVLPLIFRTRNFTGEYFHFTAICSGVNDRLFMLQPVLPERNRRPWRGARKSLAG